LKVALDIAAKLNRKGGGRKDSKLTNGGNPDNEKLIIAAYRDYFDKTKTPDAKYGRDDIQYDHYRQPLLDDNGEVIDDGKKFAEDMKKWDDEVLSGKRTPD
jgi:hypothetical protein